MAALVDRAIRSALRSGLRKGLGEGSRVWLVVGSVAVAVRVFQRMAAPGTPTVVTEELAPGQSILIRHIPAGEQ